MEVFFLDSLGDKFGRYGTEIDDSAISFAKSYPSFANNIYSGEFTEIDFKNMYFDLIVLRGTIQHVLNPGAYLKKILNLLAQDGIFFICATPNGKFLR